MKKIYTIFIFVCIIFSFNITEVLSYESHLYEHLRVNITPSYYSNKTAAKYSLKARKHYQNQEVFNAKKALKYINKSIELNPDNINEHKNKALILLMQDDYQNGFKELDYVLSHKSDYYLAYYYKAIAYRAQKNLVKANEYIDIYLNTPSQDKNIGYETKAYIKLDEGNYEEAMILADRITTNKPNKLILKGEILYMQEKFEESLKALEEAYKTFEPKIKTEIDIMDAQKIVSGMNMSRDRIIAKTTQNINTSYHPPLWLNISPKLLSATIYHNKLNPYPKTTRLRKFNNYWAKRRKEFYKNAFICTNKSEEYVLSCFDELKVKEEEKNKEYNYQAQKYASQGNILFSGFMEILFGL